MGSILPPISSYIKLNAQMNLSVFINFGFVDMSFWVCSQQYAHTESQ